MVAVGSSGAGRSRTRSSVTSSGEGRSGTAPSSPATSRSPPPGRLHRVVRRGGVCRHVVRSAPVRAVVEDLLDDRAGAPGDPPVVVEELTGVGLGAVAAGPGDPVELEPLARQLVARAAAHEEDRVAGAAGGGPRPPPWRAAVRPR